MFRYLLPACLLFLMISGCKDTDTEPFNKNDAAPGPVSNVRIENTPGGANITYDRPANMLYIKATYFIRPGVEREVKTTYYKNTLTIDGFADTREYEVKLYAVSRGENASDPVTVKVNPLTPPIQETFKSLNIQENFGGIRVTFINPSEANLVLNVLVQDSIGDYVQADAFYTKRKAGFVNVRGFAPVKRKFAVYIRDRWDNHSDTAYTELTPVFEQQLDKTKFKEVRLPTDTYTPHSGFAGVTALWDDKWNSGTVFHTKPGTGLPQWFTFDLGANVSLSRFKFYHRLGGGQQSTDGAYAGGDPKVFELYGSNDPNKDGSWDSWTLIGEFQSVKPSGSPQGIVTSEDFQYAVVDGEEFDIPPGTARYRYLRWRTNKVWGSLDHHYLAELTFFGSKD
ncbi:MAG TPA: DUF5000 domain-containing lipoprotein [Pedobacter sp.]|uniref:DUF5000 domain-containing lipoprotein n=1 Tax=Pedobacter sp. TaxID=1411316 RepID=UPI002BEFE626|nr:DUF5000 domain-containing lipoprotein [Pedobacter sp.]HMI01944.1 DUF5000 domain-containing lipoprotein [Pedobacter sp.]